MSARDDYPKLANKADNQRVWFSGAECERALDEIDSLRARLNAADSECHLCMYLEAQKRYMALTDAVFEKLSHGDVHGVIQFAMEMADGCDYVDEEMAEVADLLPEAIAIIQEVSKFAPSDPLALRIEAFIKSIPTK